MKHKEIVAKSNTGCHNTMLIFIKFVQRGPSMELLNYFHRQMTKEACLFIEITLNLYFHTHMGSCQL